MNTLEALQKRKSIRGYLGRSVEEDKLKTILKYGNKAPNAGDFHMTVIRDKQLLRDINDTVKEAILKSDNEFAKKRISIPGYLPTYGAPVLIILSAPKDSPYSAVNTACAVTNMGVASVELGLGTCYLAGVLLAFQAKPELLEKINLPAGYIPQCGMALGYESSEQIPGKEWMEDYSNINYI